MHRWPLVGRTTRVTGAAMVVICCWASDRLAIARSHRLGMQAQVRELLGGEPPGIFPRRPVQARLHRGPPAAHARGGDPRQARPSLLRQDRQSGAVLALRGGGRGCHGGAPPQTCACEVSWKDDLEEPSVAHKAGSGGAQCCRLTTRYRCGRRRQMLCAPTFPFTFWLRNMCIWKVTYVDAILSERDRQNADSARKWPVAKSAGQLSAAARDARRGRRSS